jgi:hypothetical protein
LNHRFLFETPSASAAAEKLFMEKIRFYFFEPGSKALIGFIGVALLYNISLFSFTSVLFIRFDLRIYLPDFLPLRGSLVREGTKFGRGLGLARLQNTNYAEQKFGRFDEGGKTLLKSF